MDEEVEVGAEVEVGVVEVVEVVEGDIDLVDLVEATTPVVEVKYGFFKK